MKHRHICGLRGLSGSWSGEPPRNVEGCGFVWEHVRLRGVSDQVYADNHLCPNCGLGPWYTIADHPRELNRALSPAPPVIGMGAVLRPNPNNPAFVPQHELAEFYEYARARADVEEAFKGIEQLLGQGSMAAEFDGLVLVIDPENKTVAGFNLGGRRR